MLLLMPVNVVNASICWVIESQADFAVLPEYCKAKCGYYEDDPAVFDAWEQRIGRDNFLHMHHFCNAYVLEARAVKADNEKDRQRFYHAALQQNNYVIGRWTAGVPFLVIAYYRQGLLASELGDEAVAFKAYRNAIEINPNYTPAYAAISDWFGEHGDREQAVEYLRKGLDLNPESRLLRERLEAVLSQK